ncbi:MAG: 3-deoxy-8-phosphooctulonate synthase [Flammeovirgaceae bacterium]|nr:3-deoxy-8-phosphooctulonate synthase [Flammeovirgaceae bacterium]
MNKLFLIAGPCIIENSTVPLTIGKEVKSLCDEFGIDFIFKASYKKANRTKLESFKGIGFQESLEILQGVGRALGVRTITDVHESYEPELVAQYVDILQIPAFLCRQTELLLAAGNTGKTINIKKGQFVSPEAMRYPLEKVQSTGNQNIWLCERGFTFGYENLVVDVTAIPKLKKHGVPVVMDCTHSLQQPNQKDGISGGDPEMIGSVALSAVATGADGLFIETHPDPASALSDGKSMLPLHQLRQLLQKVVRVRKAISE